MSGQDCVSWPFRGDPRVVPGGRGALGLFRTGKVTSENGGVIIVTTAEGRVSNRY